MAVLDRIFNFFVPAQDVEPEIIVPALPTVYEIRLLTEKHLKEVLKLNLRCFKVGENYTKYTFSYLLNEPNCLSYRIVTPLQQMVGFIFIMTHEENETGHITTIGAWRSAARKADEKFFVSEPISRWFIVHFLCLCRNSIGSSIVTI